MNAFVSGEMTKEVMPDLSCRLINAPLKGRQGIYGVLQIKIPMDLVFSPSKKKFVSLVVNTAGSALENAVILFDQSHRVIEDLQLVNETSRKLNSNMHFGEMIAFLKQQLLKAFRPTEIAFVFNNERDSYDISQLSTDFFSGRSARGSARGRAGPVPGRRRGLRSGGLPSAPAGGWKTTMSPISGILEVVDEAVDEDALADVEGRLHRFGGDLVRLDDPGLDRQRQPEGKRDDDDQLDEPAAFAIPASGSGFQAAESSSESPRLVGSSSSASSALKCPRSPRPRAPPRPCSAAVSVSAAASGSAGPPRLRSASARPALLGRLGGRALVPRPRLDRGRLRHDLLLADALGVDRAGLAARRAATATTSSSIPQRRSATRAALPIAAAQVVELGPAHVAARRDLEFLDLRRVQRERPLDADAEGLLADGEGLAHAGALAPQHDALEDLGAFARALDHLEVDADAVARGEVREALLQLGALDAVDYGAHGLAEAEKPPDPSAGTARSAEW